MVARFPMHQRKGGEFRSMPMRLDLSQPLRHLSSGLFQTDGPWRHASRVIDSVEILLGQKGIVHLEQDGVPFLLTPGTLLLLQPGLPHRGTRDSEGETSFFWAHFPLPDNARLLPEKALQDLSDLPRETVLLPDCFPTVRPEKPAILFRQLLHTANAGYRNPLACDFALSLIVLELSHQYMEGRLADEAGLAPQRRIISEILEWIRLHLPEPFTLGDVAQRFGFNEDYLTRLFKRHLGMGFVRYVNTERLARARNLLAQTWFGVKEIAWQCGFPDEKYFMRLFREMEGMTPTAYRNAYHRTHVNNQ